MLKVIHASEDIAAAREKAVRVIEKLRGLRLTRAAELAEAAVEETLTYYAFPEEHWRRVRTNNPLERNAQSAKKSGSIYDFPQQAKEKRFHNKVRVETRMSSYSGFSPACS